MTTAAVTAPAQPRYRAVIDRRFPLDEVIAATRYVETGQKIGNVVLIVRREA